MPTCWNDYIFQILLVYLDDIIVNNTYTLIPWMNTLRDLTESSQGSENMV